MEVANFSNDEVSAPYNLDFSDSPIPHNYDEEELFGCQGHGGFLKTAAVAPIHLQKQAHLLNVNCPDDDTIGLGTPSVPPIIDSDFPLEKDSECSLGNEPTDPHGSWPSRQSLDYDGTKSETSIEQKPKPKTVAKPTVVELAQRLDKTFTDDREKQTPHLQYYNTRR
ncbi:uncharacterized protein LOC114394992 [Glycine soja]|uniref:uncharacterized protein LOC114394992 n=1 Tax=Glycine soja TaxID=3848 RepID=UPI00103AAEF5|nr:uncharacterized protein LOC114394992 [Glycine soja]